MKRSEQEWTPQEVLVLCREKNVKAVDFRYVDFLGAPRRFTIPVGKFHVDLFETGLAVDGAGVGGTADCSDGELLIVPHAESAYVDPFSEVPTLVVACGAQDPVTREDHPRDPRSVARRAQNYLVGSGAADSAWFAAEADFYLFEDVRFDSRPGASFVFLDGAEGRRNTTYERPHASHETRRKERLASLDGHINLRNDLMMTLIECGLDVESQLHAPAGEGPCRVELKQDDLIAAADAVTTLKHVVKNVARKHGRTATFMPKPLFGQPGCGLRTHLSLWKEGQPLFAGSGYGGLSDAGLHAIGGLLKHAPAILAFCAPTTNSYKRLAAGCDDAPISLAYSSRDRRAACRVPTGSQSPKSKRIEFGCPDGSANPYLAFSAMLMAAIDGIQNKLHPGAPLDRDAYEFESDEGAEAPQAPASLAETLRALQADHDFLLRGDVFTPEAIENWIAAKIERELDPVRLRPHPHEFAMYFDV